MLSYIYMIQSCLYDDDDDIQMQKAKRKATRKNKKASKAQNYADKMGAKSTKNNIAKKRAARRSNPY